MHEVNYTKWEYPESDLEVLEEFNGHVTEINSERCTMWLDWEDLSGEHFSCEAPLNELTLKERPYLKVGAYCRLRIYKDPDYEGKAITEFIFFKRTWSQE